MAQHPTEETLNITRKFLGGELGTPGVPPGGRDIPSGPGLRGGASILPPQQTRLPAQAAPIAGQRAFGQQGARRRPGREGLITPQGGSLSDRVLDMPGRVGFAQTPQGQAILQRILSGGRRRF